MWFNDLEKFEKCFSVYRNYKQIDWGMFLSLWGIAHHSVKYVYIYKEWYLYLTIAYFKLLNLLMKLHWVTKIHIEMSPDSV